MVLDLAKSFERAIANQTLKEVYAQLEGDQQADIPFLVWFLENPASPFALPGKVDLRNHDYIHILLGRGKSAQDEAFVIGFTMGNDLKTTPVHRALFKFFARFFYPKAYQFMPEHLTVLDLGFNYGRRLKVKHLNTFDFAAHQHETIAALRQRVGIHKSDIRLVQCFENWLVSDSIQVPNKKASSLLIAIS